MVDLLMVHGVHPRFLLFRYGGGLVYHCPVYEDLDLAELQALRRKPMFMKDWIARLDDYLQMTDSEVLQNAGSVSHALAEQKAKAEYEKYKRLHRDDVTPVEVAFLDSVEQQAKQLKK